METVRWRKYPDVKPREAGEYLVTTKRPTAGRWVALVKWTGERWAQKCQVMAWMPKPEPYAAKEKQDAEC